MHYYPVWFDYAKWFFAVVGAMCAFMMLSEPAGRKRGWLKLGFCSSVAVAMLFGGIAGVLFNTRAATRDITGQAFGVNIAEGGRSSTTWFRVPQPLGEFDFSIGGAHPAIENGETLHVVYQEASYLILRIDVLDGPSAGYTYRESNSVFSAWFVIAAAIALAGYGLLDWMNDGTAIPPPDNTSSPDGDVDTKSMLDLS